MKALLNRALAVMTEPSQARELVLEAVRLIESSDLEVAAEQA